MTFLEHLFNKRILFIIGKGGVGKSTIAAALALLAAQRGKKILLAELDTEESISFLFGLPRLEKGSKREIHPGIYGLNVDGKASLEEYLSIILKSKRLTELIFRSKIYNYFVSAAPGLKELMAIGKIWYEEQLQQEEGGKYLWDLIIVDTPATGHALQYMRMPKAAYDSFATGLVHREAKRVLDLITDPEKTLVNIVTTAEEMPVNETLEVADKISKKVKFPLGYIFINKIFTPLWSGQKPSLSNHCNPSANSVLEDVWHWGELRMDRWERNKIYIDRLESTLAGPFPRIPYIFSEEITMKELLIITREIENQLEKCEFHSGVIA
jgi:anion-transporting  ArsA/GET3 family ATPase